MKRLVAVSGLLLLFLFVLPLFFFKEPALLSAHDASPSPEEPPSPMQSPSPAPPLLVVPHNTVAPIDTDGDVALQIRVLVDGEVRLMCMRDYLFCVLAAEMPASFPEEALRAQAVAARTYAEYKMFEARRADVTSVHPDADVCDQHTHCKAFMAREEARNAWGDKADVYTDVLERVIRDTDSQVVLYDEEPIVAVFHAASAGQTERAADVWGGDLPYLQSVASPGETASPQFYGTVRVPLDDFKQTLAEAYPDIALEGDASAWIGAAARSEAGGVLSLTVGGVSIPGTILRTLFALRSAHLTLRIEGGEAVFETEGYGHGVGLSQYGARALALEGKNYVEILQWYYTGVIVSSFIPSFT